MKNTMLLSAAFAALALLASCAREDYVPDGSSTAAGHVQTLTATFAPGETRTAFVGGVYKWKTNDNIVVRSSNANGYSTFKYTGDDTDGEATFTNDSEDIITYGQNSFAIYPAKTSGTYPKEEEGSLKPVLKDTYTWFDGNVEAPMLARVESGTPLAFKHLGGCLKVTYKNVPPKATKIVVYAPVTDDDLIAEGKVSYKIHSTMNQTYNWTTAGGGFDPTETPYVKAYDHSGTYKLTVNISAATAAQRASDDGITAYIPLPVGPVDNGGQNVYPQLKIWLAFNDNTEVPGSLRTATNVQIERAHIKPMPAISLTKYSVEVVAGTDGSNATTNGIGTAAKFNQIRGLCWLDNTNLLITESNGSKVLRKYNKSTAEVSSAVTLGGYAPWQGQIKDGVFYYADKGGSKVRSWNTSTNAVADVVTSGLNNPMCVRFHGSDAYVVCRNGSKILKYTGGLTEASSTFFDFSTLEHGTDTNWPTCILFDANGYAIVPVCSSSGTSTSAYYIYVFNSSGEVVTTIGKGTKAANVAALVDGASANATFGAVNGIVLDSAGNIYLAESVSNGGVIRKIVKFSDDYSDAVVMTVAGCGSSYKTAVGATANFSVNIQDLIFDPENSEIMYVIDQSRYTLRKITIQ